MTAPHRHIGVIGSGVAGLTAAYVASRTAHVTLFEADDRLGGHADTHVVASPDGELRIDTGFIVHNRRTYPTLLRLFAELDIATQPSEMSLSVSDQGTGVEYAGALGARGLFPTAASLRSTDHWRMLATIPRFHRQAGGCCPGLRSTRRPDSAGVPRRWRLLRPLRAPLHGADGGGRLVVRPGDLPRLPRALPLHLPRAPRHARRLRLPRVAHRHRRFGDLRRRRRRPPADGPDRHEDHLGRRARGPGRGDRRQRPRPHLRRDRRGHAPLAGPDDARVADRRPGRGARRAALLGQHRAAAHRHLAPAPGRQRPLELELPAPGHAHRSGHRHLRPDPAAAPAHRDPLPRHPRRRAPRRPGHRDRADGVRAPALHPRVRRRPATTAVDRHRPGRLRRRLPRVGLPRGRLALRSGRRDEARPRLAGGSAGRRSTGRTRRLPDHDPTHAAHAVQARLRAPLPPLARRPRRPARPRPARPLRGARPPRLGLVHDPRQRRGVPRPARRRPRRRPDPDGRQPALAGLLLQPDLRLLVLRRHGCAGGRGGRGAQHVRRPARLPRPPGRAGTSPDRQGDVRLAVPRGRGPLRAGGPGADRSARHRRHPAHRRRLSPSARASPANGSGRDGAGTAAAGPTAGARVGAALRGSALIRVHGIWLWARRLPVRPRPPHHQEGVR